MKACLTLMLALAVTLVAMPAQAETIYLKNGARVSGKIVKEDAEQFTVQTPEATPDTTHHMDSMDSAFAAGAVTPDSAAPPTTPKVPADSAAASAARSPGFTVQFASVLSADKAREIAGSINVGGKTPRVVETTRNGSSIYRVVLGPYPSKPEAEKVGRASGKDFWVFEGAP